MERIPTARFPQGNVVWLKVGGQQLHLFESDDDDAPTMHHHFGFDVDDFDAVYEKAKAMGILDTEAFGAPLRSHPSGWVQLYLRDPAGNLLEVDWPDMTTLAAVDAWPTSSRWRTPLRRRATRRSRRCTTREADDWTEVAPCLKATRRGLPVTVGSG